MTSHCNWLFGAVILCFLTFFPSSLSAQRLAIGQKSFSLRGTPWIRDGASLELSKCNYSSKMICGVTSYFAPKERYKVVETESHPSGRPVVSTVDLTANWGYLFRCYGNRSRSLNFWVGGTADIGARLHPNRNMNHDGIPTAVFIYGLSPRVEAEVFPFPFLKSLSLSAYFSPRVQLYGPPAFEDIFYPQAGAGLTWYFF
jgi:hypothetical protein